MKKVAVLQSQSLVSMDYPERGVTAGGTQRYTIQMAKLLQQENYQVFIIARANVECPDFDTEVGHVIVVKATRGLRGDYVYSKYIYDYCMEKKADFVCYVDLGVAKYFCVPQSLTLQHGIGWDEPVKLHQRVKRFFFTREYIRIAQKFNKIICVDTNFINWARQYDKNFFKNIGKYVYIPNFADETLFVYKYKKWDANDELVLLYPRRLVEYRGYKIFIEMCECLKKKGYKVHPVLAFEENASDDYTGLLEGKLCSYSIVHPKLDEIGKEYSRAFLAFVPTIWSEGTSLSAIEAICSGCPVITSDVGGLGNIVIPGLTGEIVTPTVKAFVEATEKALKDTSIRDKWSQNCSIVKDAFLTPTWNERVLSVIRELQ